MFLRKILSKAQSHKAASHVGTEREDVRAVAAQVVHHLTLPRTESVGPAAARLAEQVRQHADRDATRLYTQLVTELDLQAPHTTQQHEALVALQSFVAAKHTQGRLVALTRLAEVAVANGPSAKVASVHACLASILLAHVVGSALEPAHWSHTWTEAQAFKKPLKRLRAAGVVLPKAAVRLIDWDCDPNATDMYDALLASHAWPREAARTLRFLASMRGPEQDAFATLRVARQAPHVPTRLGHGTSNVHSMQQSLNAMLSDQPTRQMLTVCIGKPYSVSVARETNIDMTFHGRTQGGFRYSARMFVESYEAALVSAWGADAHTIGSMTRKLLLSGVDACAEGKTAEALAFLEAVQLSGATISEIDRLWQAHARGEASYSDIMTEHVRLLFEQSWRQYAQATLGKEETFLSEHLSSRLDTDTAFARDYFNTDILVDALTQQKARITTVGRAAFEALVAEQADDFATLEWGSKK